MKTRLAIIIVIGVSLFGIFSINGADGSVSLDSKSFYDLYYENELVVKGTVISLQDDPADEQLQRYDIKIIERLSVSQQTSSLITVFAPKGENSFDADDIVFLYLNKSDAKYMISPYSFKIHPNCKDLSFSGLSYLPWQGRPRSATTGTFPEILDMQGNRSPSLDVGTSYNIQTDKFRFEPTDQLDLEIIIQNLDTGEVVLKERKIHQGNPCSWKNVQWSVTPDKQGNYFTMVTKHKQLFSNNIIRPTLIQTAEFTVGTDDSLFSATSSGTNPSLMNQLRVGIPAEHIVCRHADILVFKYSDSAPVCVREQSVSKLIERGWAVNSLNSTSDAQYCQTNHGTWDGQYNECTGITESQCSSVGGDYFPCENCARHNTGDEPTICPSMCYRVCEMP